MVQATPDYETVYDTIDEYEMASLSSRAEPMRGGELCSTPQLSRLSCEAGLFAFFHAGRGDSVNPAPEGEGPPTREEEEKGGEMKSDSDHEATYESMDNDHNDEYVVATLGSRAELRGGELCSTPQLSQSLL